MAVMACLIEGGIFIKQKEALYVGITIFVIPHRTGVLFITY